MSLANYTKSQAGKVIRDVSQAQCKSLTPLVHVCPYRVVPRLYNQSSNMTRNITTVPLQYYSAAPSCMVTYPDYTRLIASLVSTTCQSSLAQFSPRCCGKFPFCLYFRMLQRESDVSGYIHQLVGL